MAYCTLEELKSVLPEAVLIRLTDDDGLGAVIPGVVQEALDSAAREIDAYIGGRYKLPISDTVPPILSKLNADVAIYNLYSRVKEEIPQTREDRYKNAVRFLEQVAAGKISLGIQPPPGPPGTGEYENGARISARPQDFGTTTMEKY
ncbi:gp436 family protein [Desulfatiglans anilini]|uniref:gp436 family protein n=1 Tax=Desulfatiglans anilini TaxID=90728 RepID=UPI0003F7D67B|nr:DUF1320 domain-containing protein [Desulfatiglans anilini]